MIALAWAAPVLVLAGCGACSCAVLRGHRPGPGPLACLRRALAIRAVIVTILAVRAAIWVLRTARHPLWHARYLPARAFRRIPRLDPDGERLGEDEEREFIVAVHSWKYARAGERSRT
jgi:hypothetical protein